MTKRSLLGGLLRGSKRRSGEGRFRRLKAEVLEERVALAADWVVTGAGAGGGPHALARQSATLNEQFSFFSYSPTFAGGVRVASGDVNGDGHADMITAPGAGGGPHVRVLDGRSGQLITEFFAFESQFRGGLYVAAGDTNADGKAEVIVAADGAGSNGRVRIFNGVTGGLVSNLVAPSVAFHGGMRVAAGDINGDARSDVILSASSGNVPQVMALDATSGAVLTDFFAYNPTFLGGVFVAAGDVSGDGRADIITGAGAGGGPHVKIFDGATRQELRGFFAYNPGFTGGVSVSTIDHNADGRLDILTGAGAGGGPHVRIVRGDNLQELTSFFAYNANFTGGVFVGGSLVGVNSSTPIPTPPTRPAALVDLAGNSLLVPDLAHWGDTLAAVASLRNNGPSGSGAFDVQFYLSTDTVGSTDDILLTLRDGGATYFHPPIAGNSVGAPFTTYFRLPATVPLGFTGQNLHILMRTDSASSVAETNEANNFGELGNGVDREAIVVTTTPPPNLGFRVDVVDHGLTASQLAIFQDAANTWRQIIVGDVPDVGIFGGIDDVVIDAFAVPIDGPGRVLGSAGPTFLRTFHGNLPINGQMLFDTADLAQLEAGGQLRAVILHEMGHVLGIGTLWGFKGMIQSSGLPDPRFRGALATLEYNRLFGRNDDSVPIESFFTAGPGSAEGHFRESVFDNELMTPFAEAAGTAMPLSRITAASLADLGYQVNMASSFIDSFAVPPGATAFLRAALSEDSTEHQDHAHVGGLLTDGSAIDPQLVEHVRNLLLQRRRDPGDFPVIEMDVMGFVRVPEGLAQAAIEAASPQHADLLTSIIADEVALATPARRVASPLSASAASGAEVQAADRLFAEDGSFVEDDTPSLALLTDLIGMSLDDSDQAIFATTGE